MVARKHHHPSEPISKNNSPRLQPTLLEQVAKECHPKPRKGDIVASLLATFLSKNTPSALQPMPLELVARKYHPKPRKIGHVA
jgi:hypothetical protein